MRKRLFAVAATALLPAVGLLAYNEISSREQRSAEVHREAAQAARLAGSEVEQILEGARSVLIAVAAIPAVADLDRDTCATSLARVAGSLTMTGAILLIDTDGKLICDSEGNAPGVGFSERSYVREGLMAADMVIGEYTVSKLTHAAVLPVSFPVRRDGRTVGILATGIKLDWLQNKLMERGLMAGAAVTIADRNGVILARQPFPERFVGTRIPDSFQHLLTAPAPGTLEVTSQDGTERIMGYRPISPTTPVYVSSGMSKKEAFASIDRVTRTSVSLLLLSAIVAFAAAAFVGNHFILKPVFYIIDVLENWKKGKVAARVGMTGRYGELGQVGDAIDGLLDELEQRQLAMQAAEERRLLLARELSHRVKNTLAIVTAIARQTFKEPENGIQSFAQRLAALGRTYDLLFAGDGQGSEIGMIVRNTLSPYETGGSRRFDIEGPACPVAPETGLALSLIVHELATNAMKYGALREEGGYIRIAWKCENGRVMLHWHEHDGPPIRPPEKEGFGSKLIRRAFPVKYRPDLHISYPSDGLRFDLSFDDVPEHEEESQNHSIGEHA